VQPFRLITCQLTDSLRHSVLVNVPYQTVGVCLCSWHLQRRQDCFVTVIASHDLSKHMFAGQLHLCLLKSRDRSIHHLNLLHSNRDVNFLRHSLSLAMEIISNFCNYVSAVHGA